MFDKLLNKIGCGDLFLHPIFVSFHNQLTSRFAKLAGAFLIGLAPIGGGAGPGVAIGAGNGKRHGGGK